MHRMMDVGFLGLGGGVGDGGRPNFPLQGPARFGLLKWACLTFYFEGESVGITHSAKSSDVRLCTDPDSSASSP